MQAMTNKGRVRYGEWPSPVTAQALTRGGVRLGGVLLVDGARCWLEGRPEEGGRNVLVKRSAGGEPRDLNPAPYNVRSRVHEYGGGAFLIDGDSVWFSNDADQRVYQMERAGAPVPLTEQGPYRYADFAHDPVRNRLICVREDHAGPGEPENVLVSIALNGGESEVVASGHDFYSNPRLSPDGFQLCFLAWDHPRMPWDGTVLYLGALDDAGRVGRTRPVAGGENESVFQPEWSPSGNLHFVSDRNGWWNLYRLEGSEAANLYPLEAEFGRPQWIFNMRSYGFTADGDVIAAGIRDGLWSLYRIGAGRGEAQVIPVPYSDIDDLVVEGNEVLLIAGAPDRAQSVVHLELASGETETLCESTPLVLEPASLSVPETLSFPTGDGEFAHGFFYPPVNAEFEGPEGEAPPLIVIGHGGPTSATGTSFRLPIQFWTSRGFAVLDVNYRGSSGYGRAYRRRLYGRWGIVDVEDCVNGARSLAESGRVDDQRLIIRGSSAGGYTTLAALTFHNVFKAGASYYGIGELEALGKDTHKFESRYLDQLIGPYPEMKDVYAERSPLNHAESLSCPVIFFQGLEDRVVPPNQARMMAKALEDKGIPVAHLAFEGEQHGFRKAETIRRTLEAELYFYGRVFGFSPADEIRPVDIANLR
jgi:dipeptidyl aminopeptidase/acylaminoacyl peptidase